MGWLNLWINTIDAPSLKFFELCLMVKTNIKHVDVNICTEIYREVVLKTVILQIGDCKV